MTSHSRYFVITAFLLAIYWGFMLHIALFDPLDIATAIFSEGGTIEAVSPYWWFLLATCCLFGSLTFPTRIAGAVTAVLLGLREMDLHKSFFQQDAFRTHFLRSNFYLSEAVPLSQKIMGAFLAILLMVLAVYLIKTFLTTLKLSQKPYHPAYMYIGFSFVLLAASKFADSLNRLMTEWFQTPLAPEVNIVVQAFEESAEMVTPILLCIAVILYRDRYFPASNHHR